MLSKEALKTTPETISGSGGPWALVAAMIKAAGIERVFGLPGDDMLATGALAEAGVETHWCRDQRMAMHMAAGFALTTGRPGVCILGRGPGVAAVVPALLESMTGGFPVIVIAGGFPTQEAGRPGFQKAPQLQMVSSVTKASVRIEYCGQLQTELARAMHLAMAVPAGPVYVEIPDDLPADDTETSVVLPVSSETHRPKVRNSRGEPSLPPLIAYAERPVLLVGGGARWAGEGCMEALSEWLGAPLLVTASGRGAVGENHPNFCGLSGLYLAEEYQTLLSQADVVVALGSRLEETATMHIPRSTPVYQINLEPQHFSYEFGGELCRDDLNSVAERWLEGADGDHSDPAPGSWLSQWRRAKERRWNATASGSGTASIVPVVLSLLRDRLPAESIVCHENGLMDIWSYLYPVFALPTGGTSVVPSEQTTLGFGLAASIGASLGNPDRFVVAIGGDGAFNLLTVELGTIVESGAGVLFIILDNGGYGWLESMNRQVNGLSGTFVNGAERPSVVREEITSYRIADVSGAVDILDAAMGQVAAGRTVIVRVVCSVEEGPILGEGQ